MIMTLIMTAQKTFKEQRNMLQVKLVRVKLKLVSIRKLKFQKYS